MSHKTFSEEQRVKNIIERLSNKELIEGWENRKYNVEGRGGLVNRTFRDEMRKRGLLK